GFSVPPLPHSSFSSLSQEHKKGELFPSSSSFKIHHSRPSKTLGAHLLLLQGQEGARIPISLPFDFHNLGAALSTSSILGTRKVSSTMLSCWCRQRSCMVELLL
ncbi:hypothetical protein U9M48_004453, partial [Paspalum notatum var. saurae]